MVVVTLLALRDSAPDVFALADALVGPGGMATSRARIDPRCRFLCLRLRRERRRANPRVLCHPGLLRPSVHCAATTRPPASIARGGWRSVVGRSGGGAGAARVRVGGGEELQQEDLITTAPPSSSTRQNKHQQVAWPDTSTHLHHRREPRLPGVSILHAKNSCSHTLTSSAVRFTVEKLSQRLVLGADPWRKTDPADVLKAASSVMQEIGRRFRANE
ncbi:unnamed protein product [Urochloa humidicola]